MGCCFVNFISFECCENLSEALAGMLSNVDMRGWNIVLLFCCAVIKYARELLLY